MVAQLGSLGGGNHFIELCLDEQQRVWMFLHSGSRGVGNKIATKHINIAQRLMQQWWWTDRLPNADLAFLAQGTKEFATYLKELAWAQRFALENRAEMMDRFRCALAEWMEVDPTTAAALEVERSIAITTTRPRSGTVAETCGSPVRVPSTRTKASVR
jgi:tRNA-splicing ligase RtcB